MAQMVKKSKCGSVVSMEFSRPENCCGQSFPSPGDLSNPGVKPRSPAFQANSLLDELRRKPKNTEVGNLAHLQQILSTQELNQGLLHWKRIHHELSYQGSPQTVKNPPAIQVDLGSIPGLGRFTGEGNGNPLQHSCLENPWPEEPGKLHPMKSQSWTQLSDFHF